MIQPKELRIGNLLNHSELGIVEVIGIGKDYIHVIYNGETHYENIRSFSTITLTEEILLKFGFNEVEDERWCDMHEEFEECNYYYLSMFKIYYNPETDKFEDDSLSHFDVNLKYVHQLQNINFALTGKELTFKTN